MTDISRALELHWEGKLRHLATGMHTGTARALAVPRHALLETLVQQLRDETEQVTGANQ